MGTGWHRPTAVSSPSATCPITVRWGARRSTDPSSASRPPMSSWGSSAMATWWRRPAGPRGAASRPGPGHRIDGAPVSGPHPLTQPRTSVGRVAPLITGQNGAAGSGTANGTETFGGGPPPKRDGRQPLPVYHLPKGETLGTLAGPSGGVATWVWAAGAFFVLALLAAGFVVVTEPRRSPVPSIDVDGD